MAPQDIIRPAVEAATPVGQEIKASRALVAASGHGFNDGSSAVELKVSLIDVRNRLRPVRETAVDGIIVSVGEGQLIQAIIVRPVGGGRFELVIGAHRLAAFVKMGRPSITASIRVLTDLEARQMEIDENLVRSGLTPLEQLIFLAERVEVWAARNPDKVVMDASQPVKQRGRPPRNYIKLKQIAGFVPASMGFAAETARDTGLSASSVYRATVAVAGLHEAQRDRLHGTWIARNDAALRQLAGIGDAVEQGKVIDLLLEGKTKSIPDARALAAGNRPIVKSPSDTVQRDFEKVWKAAAPSQRDGLLHWLSGQPLPKGWNISKMSGGQ